MKYEFKFAMEGKPEKRKLGEKNLEGILKEINALIEETPNSKEFGRTSNQRFEEKEIE